MSTALTLTTWNVQNLFRPDLADQPSVEAYDTKLGLLAGTIETLDPDVIALQEIGSEGALTDLKARLDGAYPHHHLGIPDKRNISCAFLSKLKITERADIVAFPAPVLNLGVRNIDGTAIVYRVGSTLWVNRPKGGAESLDDDDILVTKTIGSQLCSIDTVQLRDRTSHMYAGFVSLGEFVPYRRVKGQ